MLGETTFHLSRRDRVQVYERPSPQTHCPYITIFHQDGCCLYRHVRTTTAFNDTATHRTLTVCRSLMLIGGERRSRHVVVLSVKAQAYRLPLEVQLLGRAPKGYTTFLNRPLVNDVSPCGYSGAAMFRPFTWVGTVIPRLSKRNKINSKCWRVCCKAKWQPGFILEITTIESAC